MSPSRTRARRVVAGFTAFCFFWSSVLPAQTLIVPDGNTATHVGTSGANTQVTTGTVRGQNAFNSFSRFNVGSGDTVNLHLPSGTQNLLNLVHDERTQIDGVLNAIRNGGIGGNVYIANPHGVVVGAEGVVNTGALHLSTPTQAFMQRFFDAPGEPSATATTKLLDGSMPIDPEGLISIRGTVNTRAGADIRAGTIEVAGAVRADAATADVFASAVNLDGLDTAQGVTVDAGRIALAASRDVTITGTVDAEGGNGADGGSIDVRAGGDIALTDGARVSASGRGTDSNGGRVVVLADRETRFARGATLAARGGDGGGDGGFIELSARQHVALDGGFLDAGALRGVGGDILLDPPSFTLANGSVSPSSPGILTFSGKSLTLEATDFIRLDGFTISTRSVDTAGKSTADSGSIVFRSARIDILNGSKLLTHADSGFKAGSITLEAGGGQAYALKIEDSILSAHADAVADGGEIVLKATEHDALPDPFIAEATTGIEIKGGQLTARKLTALVDTQSGYLFDHENAATVVNEDSPLWNAETFGEDFASYFTGFRPFVGVSIGKATSTLSLGTSLAGKDTTITVGDAISLKAQATSKANIDSYGIAAAVGYARSTADASVTIGAGTDITAGGPITIGSYIDNTIDVSATVVDPSEGSTKIPVDVAVAVTDAHGLAATTVEAGAAIHGQGTDTEDTVSIVAKSSKSLSTSVQSGAGNDLLGAAVAVTTSDTRAHATVDGEVTSATDLAVEAVAKTEDNEGEVSTTIGDTLFEGANVDTSNPKYARLNKASFLQRLAEWVFDKQEAGGSMSEDVGSDAEEPGSPNSSENANSFMRRNGLAAAVLVANHTNEALATVGGGADLEAQGNLSILAQTSEQQSLSATSEVAPSRPESEPGAPPPAGDKKNALAASVIVANFDNTARATVGGTSAAALATLDALGTISVKAETLNPYEITWAPLELAEDGITLSGFLDAIPGSDFGVPGTFFNSWAQAAAEGEDIGVAGSVNLLDFDNVAAARVFDFSVLNGDDSFFGTSEEAGDVEVAAKSEVMTVNLSGVAEFFLEAIKSKGKNMFSTGGTKAGAGGSYLGTDYTNNVLAAIDNGARVNADDLRVAAASDVTNVSIAISGAKAGKFAFGGSFSDVDVTNFTTARIGDGAFVDAARTLSILAEDTALDVNVAGGIAMKSKIGVGASVTLNDFARQTRALIGVDPFAATPVAGAGSISSGADTTIRASAGGDIWTASLAGAFAGDDKDTPKADAPTKTDLESVPEPGAPDDEEPGAPPSKKVRASDNKGMSGLHISGDVAINEIADDTRAYVDGGATVDAGVATTTGTDGKRVPSLAVTALNDSEIWALGGAVTANLGTQSSGTDVGIAGSFALNDVSGTTAAYLAGTETVTTLGDLRLDAQRHGGIRTLTASAAGSRQKSGIELAGNVSINELDNTTAAYLQGADVDVQAAAASQQAGDITVAAMDDATVYAVAGAATLGGKGGFGASISVNQVGNETSAYSLNSRVKSAGNLHLAARNENDIRVVGASLGIASGPFNFSGVGVGNTFSGHRVDAYVDNTDTRYRLPVVGDEPAQTDYALHVLGNVSIEATDQSGIDTIAAAAGASKEGAGIGASVAVNRIEQSGVRAYARNVTYDKVDSNFSIRARSIAAEFTLTPDPDVRDGNGIRVIAGAFGVGKTAGAGVAVAVNRFSATTEAYITGTLADIVARKVTVDAGGAGRITAIAAGIGAGGKFGAGGSIVTNYIGNTTRASIDDGARVEGRDNVAVLAATDDKISVAAGSAGIGLSGLGAGASVTVNKIDSQTSARVGSADGVRTTVLARTAPAGGAGTVVANGGLDDTVALGQQVDIEHYAGPDLKSLRAGATKTVTGLAVNSMSTQHIENIDTNVAAGQVAAGAAVNVNLVNGASIAEIVNADINRADAAGAANQQVDVTAGNVAYGNGFVGNVSLGVGGPAVGAGVDVHVFNRTTRAGIVDSDITTADTTSVDARSLFGASSVVIGAAVGGVAFVGSGSVAKFTALTDASVAASRVQARALDMHATGEHHLHLVGGGGAGGGGSAAAGTFALAIDDSATRASIIGDPDPDDDTEERSKIWAADGVSVVATGLFDITSYAIGGALAGGVGVAGAATVNLATSVVEARVEDTDIGEAVGDTARPVGELTIDATGDIRLRNVAGALGAGGTAGVGAGASINVLKSRVAAELVDSTVHAQADLDAPETRTGRVDVNAHSLNDVDATAITLGAGGTVGIGGAAVVTLIGTTPDAETNGELDKGGSGTLSSADSLGSASRLDEVESDGASGNGNVAFGAGDSAAIEGQASHDVKGAVTDASKPYATVAAVRGSQVTAGSMTVRAFDESASDSLVGGFGVGALGAGGGVGVTTMRSNVSATVDAASTLTLNGALAVRALVGKDPAAETPGSKGYVDIEALAGAGGLVGLGAAVAIGTVDNVVAARVDGDVAAGSVTIEAHDETALDLDATGAAVGALAAGASIGRGTKTSRVTAATGDEFTENGVRKHASIRTTAADDTTPDGAVSIQARSAGKVDVDVTAAAGGLGLGAAGADAKATDTSTVTAKTGIGSVFELGTGALAVTATAETAANAKANGVGLSLGGGIGVSIAKAKAKATVNALIDARTDVTAGALTLTASQVRRIENPQLGPLASAVSYATGSGGGLLFGVNASNSEAETGAEVGAFINEGTLLDIGGDVGVFANADGVASATVSGLALGGLLAVGANDALAKSSSITTAKVAALRDDREDGTSIDGSLTVQANGVDGTYASATAGAGGLIAGAAAKAETDNRSTTLAQLESAPTVDGRIVVRAQHGAHFNGLADSTSASLFGASGGRTGNTVVAVVDARIARSAPAAAAVNLRAGGLTLMADNAAYKISNGYDLTAGAGGLLGGAAARTYSSVSLQTNATIGPNAELRLRDTTGGGATVSAVNRVNLSDRVKLDAGGAIAVARAESEIVATMLAQATLGANALLDSVGDVYFSAGNQGSVFSSANAKTYGLAGAAQGRSRAVIDADGIVAISGGARIRSDGNIALAAGRDASGAADSLSAIARTDLYNKTVFPVETNPDADAVVWHDSALDIKAGSRVNAVRDIQLIADRGVVVADGQGIGKDMYRAAIAAIASFFSNLFGGGDVNLDIHGGSSFVANHGLANVDGEVLAGYQHARRFDVDEAGAVLPTLDGEPIAYDPSDENLIQNLLNEYEKYQDLVAAYALNPDVQAAYDGELMRIRRQLADLGFTSDPADAIGGLVPVDNVPARFLNLADVRARGGDIAVVAGALVGGGRLSAPGNASIRIENKSSQHLRLDKLVIEDVGGKLSFNGALVGENADIARRNVPVSGKSANFSIESGKSGAKPEIVVLNTYVLPPQSDGSIVIPPDIQITDDIINPSGNVTIKSLRGNVVLGQDVKGGPKIIADTIDIEAGNDFIQPYRDALYNIGGQANDPTKLWAAEAQANESRPKPPNTAAKFEERRGEGSIIAGNNVYISARILNINGTVQSGIADWSVALDADLNDDIDTFRKAWQDALAAGETPASSRKQLSAFIDDPRGTIGAFYNAETDLIELEGVRVRGGYMQLFGDIINTGGGNLKVMDGYGTINVENSTNRELVVNGLDTGNGIEGQLLITDTSRSAEIDVYVAKTDRIEKRVRPVTTRYTRIGEEMKIEELVLFDGKEFHQQWRDAAGADRLGIYDIVDGKRYVWTTGLDRTTQTVKSRSDSRVFGFIPSGSEVYTNVSDTTLSDGPLPLGDFTRVDAPNAVSAPDYEYEYERIETDEEQFVGRETSSTCSVWFIFCIERTYTIKDTFVSGSRDFHTHSVKADHDIGIEFIGTDHGVLTVDSAAGIQLGGVVRNTTGEVKLTTTQGAITSVSDFSALRGTSISLQAKNGIGGTDAAVVTEAGNGAVTAITESGDVVLASRQGDLVVDRVATGNGVVQISADEDLLGTEGGSGPQVSARRIDLTSTLGTIGAEGRALRIAAGASTDTGPMAGLPAGFSASAAGSIFVTQTAGDLELDSVVSGGGDVSLTVLGGNIRDGNSHDTRDTRAEAELEAQWNDMGLVGDAAEQSKMDLVDAFRKQRNAAYQRYWQQRREQVRTVGADGKEVVAVRTLDYDPQYRHRFSAQEVADMKASGADDAEIQGFADARTDEYHDSHARFGATGYDQDFEYLVTDADLRELKLKDDKLLQESYKWTLDELRYGQNLDVLNRTATDTETIIEAPNVSGRNVTLIATAGSVGTERDSFIINGKDRPKDDPSTPEKENALTREERIALSAAEVDDISIDEAAMIATIVQREDIDVVATGAIHVEGRSHVYLGGEQDLNIKSVTSDGQVRIKGAEGIFDVSTDAAPTVRAGGLIVEAAHGDIGAAGDPLRIALANGTTLTARAGGSIFLDERAGGLRVASVLAKGTVELSALGSVTDARAAQDSVAINAAAIRLSSRTGDVGSAASPFSLFASTGAFGGTVAGGVYATTPTGDLRVQALKAGGDVQLRAPRSLLGVGTAPHVTGAKIDLIAGTGTIGSPDQFFSVDSNGKVLAKADTGLWFEEWNGDLQARDIGTRTGPLKIRVRNGNALFDNLYSDEVLDFDLAGGSLVVGYLEADGVDLTVRQEGATLLVGEMRIADGARLRADRILLPKLVHTGALDTLLLDLRGNDDGLANLVDVDIESASPVVFTSLATRLADIFSSSRELSLFDATITERGDIRHPANAVIIDNGSPRLLPGPAQLFTDGDPFFLALAETARIQTNALIVSYDDNFVVNAFSTENSVMRMTQKAMAVQDNVSTAALQGDLFGGDAVEAGSLIDLDGLESAGFWQVPGANEFGVAP